MFKWKIVIPILIVVVVGLAAWLQLAGRSVDRPPVNDGGLVEQVADESSDEVSDSEAMDEELTEEEEIESINASGQDEIGAQADALVTALLDEYDETEMAAGDGSDVVDAELGDGSDDSDIFNVDYYEE
ncbi:hypothetical protein A2480_00120 [Candidatus Uhrbacteria bacterium RIFOXYC2_FULL_47_19]|uniref:Uncharacterized protein n=1 Tax=Candidatus Uhrbacteria bacterium RIFOXYC2_FULL_47_19 TaxID=1802424 RepID=A0A1F7WDJ7_9BACT|nr:MAG: hypothetical protein A2480_00120 [Candidatus Uhrbacteria bacterium RIFOXYC2_FULL_47_19]HCC22044.1 hypothetical protein [Candidatus Uhrbacteria bacterium]